MLKNAGRWLYHQQQEISSFGVYLIKFTGLGRTLHQERLEWFVVIERLIYTGKVIYGRRFVYKSSLPSLDCRALPDEKT